MRRPAAGGVRVEHGPGRRPAGDEAGVVAPGQDPVAADPSWRALVEERDFLLRSLCDLDAERASGDLDDSDYAALREDYTRRAADVLRRIEQLDAPLEPPPPPAEATEPPVREDPEPVPPLRAGRRTAVRRGAIALGVVLCILGAGWAAAAESGVRLPGATITGDAVGAQKIAGELVAAAQAVSGGHLVQGLRDYQAVLDVEPDNPVALTGYAAILVASDQAGLVARAAVMLAKAEHADAAYVPAYAYLGRAMVLLGDYGPAVRQLRTFLADQSSGPLSSEARSLLAYARAHASTPHSAATGPG